MPKILNRTDPPYSEEARRARVSTSVLIGLTVNARGEPENVQVKRGAGFGLDEQAVKTIQRWRFEPATKNGARVAMQFSIEVVFRLLDNQRQGQLVRLDFASHDVPRPELLVGTMPVNASETGRIRLTFTITPEGMPQDPIVVESTPVLWAENALDAIREWRFSRGPAAIPATLEITAEPLPVIKPKVP